MLLHESFQDHAAHRPYAVALTTCDERGERHLTYGELNGLANRFAHALIESGVTAEVRVGLHLPPGPELIGAMLGVMKAGGAWVPLDPGLPDDRLARIIELAEPGVIVTQRTSAGKLPGNPARRLFADGAITGSVSCDDPRQPVNRDDLCYVMFTSGSSGGPKGVMVTHGNLERLFDDIGARLEIDADDVWSLFHPFSFGYSVWETWGALRHGGRLVIVPPPLRTDPARLFELLRAQHVTMFSQTPSAFRQNLLTDAFGDVAETAIRCIVLSGEAVDAGALKQWFAQSHDGTPRLVNTYAITETAGQLTFASLTADAGAVGVGRPLAHAELALVDEAGTPVAAGQSGELWVGGPAIARGYVGSASLTDERFVAQTLAGFAATRWYRTGDRARLTGQGNLEFLGRTDDQVKLRGYRIEPGEIATALREHPAIDDAAVVLRTDHGVAPRLVGYVVPREKRPDGEPPARAEFWPSIGPYQMYDEFLYDLMSAEGERLACYREAFEQSVRDRVVLDIGTGEHALLARLCIEAGARKVYAVEILEEACRKAQSLVRAQGLENRVIVLHGDIASLDLPERVDVCTQGIIGNIGSADGIVPIWNSARRLFAPGCIPIPARCRTWIAAVELPDELVAEPSFGPVAQRYAEQIFERVGRRFDIRLCLSDLPANAVISDAHVFEDLDFYTELSAESRGAARMRITRDARLDGYLVWTVVTTSGEHDVDYRRTQRAWLPVFFPLGETGDRFGIAVREHDEIEVNWSAIRETKPQPDYRVVTTVANHGSAGTFEYLSRIDETALNGTALYRALWNGTREAPASPDPQSLQDWLAQRLPNYMVPTAWVELDRLPLTHHHKLDRDALPEPRLRPGTDREPPRDALEHELAALWEDLLGLDGIGIHDNFFDLGGDSISAVRLTSALQRLLDDAVMLVALFDAPTVAGLGRYLREHHADAVAARFSGEGRAAGTAGPVAGEERDENDAPLSFQQQSFWVLNQLYPSMTGSNEQFVIPIDGTIDVSRLESAWNGVLERHEILRTVFRETETGVRQIVLPHRPIKLPVESLSAPDGEDRFFAAAEKAIGTRYDLSRGPLIDARLYRLSPRQAKLLVNAHHIIADGLSIRIIRDELAALYERPGARAADTLPAPVLQYRAYSIRQRAESQDAGWERSLDFWRETLRDAPPSTALPMRAVHESDDQWRGRQRRIGFVIDVVTADDLRALSRRTGATLFMTLLAAFRVLLTRCSGQSDIMIGSPVTARTTGATRDMVGCLVNNVVFRNPVDTAASFMDVLATERDVALAALQHADVPFERVVETLHPRRRFGEHPLFQILFLFEDAFATERHHGEQRFGLETLNTSRCSYWDIEFSVSDNGTGGVIRGYLGYSAERFDDAFAAALPVHYDRLLRRVIAEPETPVGHLALLEAPQRRRSIENRPVTPDDWPGPARLHERFAVQVERSPDAVALCARDRRSLSYRELADRADLLAGQLRARGIGPGDYVGIGVGRSFELVIGIIAILKTGAAYVPLDPSYPSLRLQYIVAQTGLRTILADAHLPRSVSGTLDTIRLDNMQWSQKAGHVPVPADGYRHDAAYVLYTSGSTGSPKGVIGRHRGTVNRCEWMWHEYDFTTDDVFCLRTSPNFVDSLWEIFGPLTHGAALRVIADADVGDPVRLVEQLATPVDGRSVSHVVVVPSLLEAILDIDARLGRRLPNLRSWITSGEPLPPDLLRRFRRACPGVTLLNTYGTTETWDATCFDTSSWQEHEPLVPIGTPIAHVHTHVLDECMQPVPVGFVGELYVGGVGLGGGYLDHDEPNATRFVPDPFAPPGANRMLYRTGDLARLRPDGQLECLGRADRQVKLRGFRIEPDEVAAVLRAHPGVGAACVDLRRRPGGEPILAAYWQPAETGFETAVPGEAPTEALRDFLRTRLPAFMLPGVLIEIERMPLTPNGKIDRRALPDPTSTQADDTRGPAPFVAPGTETECAIAALWREVLGIERAGLHDDFFDSGGHSLSATRLLARIRAQFDIGVDLARFFDAPTIVNLARHVDALLAAAEDAGAGPDGATGTAGPGRIEREGERLPLSFAQERLWFLNELDPDSPAYNIAFTIHVSGELAIESLQQALDRLVQRHEALRTRFRSIDGRPHQEVLAGWPVPIHCETLHGDDSRQWERRLAELSARPFALDGGPLLRLHVLRGAPKKCLLLVVIHHMVSDGLSNGIFFDELATLYDAIVAGREPELTELPIQYADFASWQRRGIDRPELDAQLRYWTEQLRTAPPALALPTDRPRAAEQRFRGAWLWRELSGERAETLRAFGRQHRCTLFMVLLGAFDVLLSRYSGQTDIVVGSPIAGRNWYELDGLIGLFVNTVALRSNLSDDPTFAELLGRVRQTTLDSQANQDLPFERLVEFLRPDRTLSHAPVFQVMFNMTPIPDRTRNVAGVRMRVGRLQDHGVSTFDLTLNVGERADGLDLVFEYDRDLFDRQTIERFATHFDHLLSAVPTAAGCPVSALPLWPDEAQARLLAVLNPPPLRDDRSPSFIGPGLNGPGVVELFEARVDRRPMAIAVEYGEHRLTYRELEQRANVLAERLRASGIEPRASVAICLERSADLVAAVLGVLKAGCAYMPLDPAYPAARLADMLAVVQPAAMITQTFAPSVLSAREVPTIMIDADRGTFASRAVRRPRFRPRSEDPAYVLFTSGSTGTPRAVAVTHGNLASICRAWQDAYALTPDDRHLQMASFSFDVFTGDWVRALCTGGSLVLCPRQDLLEPARLHALLTERRITCAEFVPAVMRGLLAWLGKNDADLSFMRLIVVGSDRWYESESAALVARTGPKTRVINSYGTAETTIDSTYFEVARDMTDATGRQSAVPVTSASPVPIGRPFTGTRVYVCDAQLRLVPPGVPGELCIGGAGVSSGTIGASNRSFVDDPFLPGGRLYRTGDRARYRSDGTLELLGRMDRQFKLRGFRIEPGDIEAALCRRPEIAAAAVVVPDDSADVPVNRDSQRLVAYVVPAVETLDPDAVRAALRGVLPDYMVPSCFVELEALPLSQNGKVDRLRLPAPAGDRASTHVEPAGPLAGVLLELYRDVLGIEHVGLHDSFFDLGGHSLLATQLVSRIRDVLEIELPLRALFEDPTIAGLVTAIEGASRAALPPVRPVPLDAGGMAPVSLMQQRLWFLSMLEPDSPAYHLHWSVRLTGALDRTALSRAVDALVDRHAMLRTTFVAPDGEPRQRVAAHGSVRVEYQAPAPDPEARIDACIARPFDLAAGPLLRVHVLPDGPDRHVLLLVIHHIIADGWSIAVLCEELSQAYNACRRGELPGWALPDAPGLPVQYADYARWQRDRLTGEALTRQLAYWRERLDGLPARLELPADRPRPARPTHAGAWLQRSLPSELTASVQAIGRAEGCTLFMVLVAAFDAALARYTGSTDIVIGTPIAGRNRTELEGLIGFFVNTLVLRTSVDGNPTFRELLVRVRQTALGAYAHADLPFEKLVETLQPERNPGVNPIVQVLFTVHNQPVQPFTPDGLTVEPMTVGNTAAKFDLSVHVSHHEDGLQFGFGYNADLFDADTIEAFAQFYESILTAAARDGDVRLGAFGSVPAPVAATDWSGNLVTRFVSRVQCTPDACAIRTADATVSYGQLDERANAVAHRLLAHLPRPGSARPGAGPRIGLLCRYDERLIAGMLGILKAGCAWVPLDPAWPSARMAAIAADAGLTAVVTDAAHRETAGRLALPLIDADAGVMADGPAVPVHADALACIIYTSGSTGAPRGVAQTHGGVVIQAGRYGHALRLGPDDRLSALSGYAYDAAIQDIFGALLNGAAVCPVPALDSGGRLVEARQLVGLLASGAVTVLHATPSLYRYLFGGEPDGRIDWSAVRAVVLGGEPVRRADFEAFRAHFRPGTQFINGFGLTESTLALQFHAAHSTRLRGERVPVGTAVAGLNVELLDESGVPGWIGEIVLGGSGLSPGYWPDCRDAVTRLPTGDLGYRRPDGQIVFTGRRDARIKLRGYRVEPGEIEAAINGLPGVTDSAVRAWQRDGEAWLAAYVVTEPGTALAADALRAALGDRLPTYLLPQSFERLDALPRFAGGKLDMAALPEPRSRREREARETGDAAARNGLEAELVSIWGELLQLDTPGVHDDFFMLGGHSLLATRVIARIRDRLSVDVPLACLFETPTIAGLAAKIETMDPRETRVPALTRLPRPGGGSP